MRLEIVYIDDEPDLCEMFRLNFESADVSVETFVDPEAALRRIAWKAPDLVFLDLRFPTTTGVQVATRMSTAIPKVLVTGDLSFEDGGTFMRVFYKPFDFEDVKRFIDERCARRAAG
jgi:DNA-binding NtrC family response regulator